MFSPLITTTLFIPLGVQSTLVPDRHFPEVVITSVSLLYVFFNGFSCNMRHDGFVEGTQFQIDEKTVLSPLIDH